ncbi:hypothetical protein CDL15_Pgr028581 [Punica granatum]|uniref:Uncharacterized protein n=1 Tax=Punica granatum TaxID=22663 RepID=A0A218VWB0_PUNGR|nr:hypothetical protein CDL15_Pgr028581 [Punica granatum]
MIGLTMGTFYWRFVEKDITNFEEFHIAVLDISMVIKKTGENVPQLKIVKAIPDVVFVPSATVPSSYPQGSSSLT